MSRRLCLLTDKWIDDSYKGKRKAPEAAVGKDIDAWCKLNNIFLRTIKSDGTKMQGGRWRKSAQGSGISDRIGLIAPIGRMIGIELKAKGKKRTLTEDQFRFLMNVVDFGGVGVVADCIEDVKAALAMSQNELRLELKKWLKVVEYETNNDEPLFT